jgi:hypothetical protein
MLTIKITAQIANVDTVASLSKGVLTIDGNKIPLKNLGDLAKKAREEERELWMFGPGYGRIHSVIQDGDDLSLTLVWQYRSSEIVDVEYQVEREVIIKDKKGKEKPETVKEKVVVKEFQQLPEPFDPYNPPVLINPPDGPITLSAPA